MPTSMLLSNASVISGAPDRWSSAMLRTVWFIASLLQVVETIRLAMVTWSFSSTR